LPNEFEYKGEEQEKSVHNREVEREFVIGETDRHKVHQKGDSLNQKKRKLIEENQKGEKLVETKKKSF